jgi:zinc transporter 7
LLVSNGASNMQALWFQVVTAGGAFLGCFVTNQFGDSISVYLLPFTAGGFVYIATTQIIPDLMRGPTSLVQTLKEVLHCTAAIAYLASPGRSA